MTDRDGITIVRCGGVAEHWKNVIRRCERGEAEVLKEDGGSRVLALTGGAVGRGASAGLVIKRWELRSPGARVKSGLRMSRAWRHWRGAERLTRAGVRTAACYAIARSVKGGVPVEWLVMDRLAGETLLRHMADGGLTPRQEHALARAVGAMIDRLIDAHLYNRDGKPSNLIVQWETPDEPALCAIDCVAIRRLSWMKVDAAFTQTFANLVIEPLGCRCLPRRSLLMRALRAYYESNEARTGEPWDWGEARNLMWTDVTQTVERHGDPTPRVDPLGPPG